MPGLRGPSLHEMKAAIERVNAMSPGEIARAFSEVCQSLPGGGSAIRSDEARRVEGFVKSAVRLARRVWGAVQRA